MAKMSQYLTRGRIAKALKLSMETLRYYESLKLIKKPMRLNNNYRVYDEDDATKLKFILMAKNLGFTLKEIKELLDLALDGKKNREKVRILSMQKSQLLGEKIAQLQKLKAVLDKLIKTCHTKLETDTCPILEALSQK